MDLVSDGSFVASEGGGVFLDHSFKGFEIEEVLDYGIYVTSIAQVIDPCKPGIIVSITGYHCYLNGLFIY